MSADHKKYHYSVTLETQDAAVLHCLRALCQHVEKGSYPQIGWGGTKQSEWRAKSGQFTLRFTDSNYRTDFISEAKRLLPGHWRIVGQSDRDPATPQR